MELNYNLLIVDDIIDNIQVAMNILKGNIYNFSFATSGNSAIELVENNRFDMILLDIMMPGIDGFEVCKRVKKIKGYKDVPIIFLTAKTDIDSLTKGFNVGGVDYITKPFNANELILRVSNHLELYKSKQLLKQYNLDIHQQAQKEQKRLLSELEENQQEMIYLLTEMIEASSNETGKHVKRVSKSAKLLAHYHKSLTKDDEEIIYHATPMHDIGKVLLPLSILHKEGKLTTQEFEVMKTHPEKAYKFLSKSDRKLMKASAIIAYEHHEKWDGSGYPRGLKGEEIHIYGRIVAVADVFDALTHKRIYKDAWCLEDSSNYIIERSGSQFDPYIVDIFKAHLDEFIDIAKM